MLKKYTVTPRSPIVTPIMSDTLFGHFCWALRYRYGEKVLEKLLGLYAPGSPAPVVFSSAFRHGYLPRPVLPPLSRRDAMAFVKKHKSHWQGDLIVALMDLKRWNQHQLISIGQWMKLKEAYSQEGLYELLLQNPRDPAESATELETSAANSINRLTNSIPGDGRGAFFSREKIWFHEGARLDLYVEINASDGNEAEWVNWFLTDYLPKAGYGADKSVGMGELLVVEDGAFDEKIFEVSSPNARVGLSLAAFEGMHEIPAFYNLKPKFGKLGGDFAIASPTGGPAKPFKKPILMYEPGAVFLHADPLTSTSLLGAVHTDPRIRHNGIPITLPFKLNEGTYETLAGDQAA